MTIARGQMKRQLYNQGGIMSVPRKKFGLGSKFKKKLRDLIPNEVAEVAVKAAPFVAPFNAPLAGAMAGLGTFDQTGKIGESVKSGLINYGLGRISSEIMGGDQAGKTFNPFSSEFYTQFTSPIGTGSNIGKTLTDSPFVNTIKTGVSNVADFAKKLIPEDMDTFKKVTKFILGEEGIDLKDIAQIVIMAKSYQLSKEDQERLNRLADEAYEKFTREQEQFRKQYSGDAPLDRIEQVNTDSSVVRRPQAKMGGRMHYGLGSLVTDYINNNPEVFKRLQSGSGPSSSTMGENALSLLQKRLIDTPTSNSFNQSNSMISKTFADLYQNKYVDFIDETENGIDDRKEMFQDLIRVNSATGGIMDSRKGYMMGSEVPLRKNPQGVTEMDFRETGGFVPPIGIKEKADDIPAMLSNNEFVFTADAVRAAGGGSVNKGAQKMYALMKQLEGQA